MNADTIVLASIRPPAAAPEWAGSPIAGPSMARGTAGPGAGETCRYSGAAAGGRIQARTMVSAFIPQLSHLRCGPALRRAGVAAGQRRGVTAPPRRMGGPAVLRPQQANLKLACVPVVVERRFLRGGARVDAPISVLAAGLTGSPPAGPRPRAPRATRWACRPRDPTLCRGTHGSLPTWGCASNLKQADGSSGTQRGG